MQASRDHTWWLRNSLKRNLKHASSEEVSTAQQDSPLLHCSIVSIMQTWHVSNVTWLSHWSVCVSFFKLVCNTNCKCTFCSLWVKRMSTGKATLLPCSNVVFYTDKCYHSTQLYWIQLGIGPLHNKLDSWNFKEVQFLVIEMDPAFISI